MRAAVHPKLTSDPQKGTLQSRSSPLLRLGSPPRPPSLFFVVVVVARGGTGRNVSGQVNALRCDKSTLRAEPGRNRSAWRSDRDPGLSLPMKLP